MKTQPTKKLKRIAIVLGICFIALAITTLVVLQRRAQVNIDATARNKIWKALLDNGSTQPVRTVKSKYGFTLRYDAQTFIGSAHEVKKESNDKEYKATTYKDEELDEERGYNLVEIGFKDLGAKQSNKDTLAMRAIKPYLTVNTSRVKHYFDRSTMPDDYKDVKKYSDLDLMAEGSIRQLKKHNPSAAYSLSDLTIDNKKFKLVKEAISYNSGNATYETGRQYTYMTVQHGRPYWMKITNFAASDDNTNAQYIAQLQGIIAGITFQQPDESLLVGAASTAQLAHVFIGTDSVSSTQSTVTSPIKSKPTAHLTNALSGNRIKEKDSINTVSDVSLDSLVTVVARNQVATVRVGVSRCANMRWTAANGAALLLPKQCASVFGSGSIITSDGYIVTNGHVVTIADNVLFNPNTDDAWNAYYTFIVQAGYTTNAELSNLVNKARSGDKNAAVAVRGFIKKAPAPVISGDQYHYIAQTSDDPIRIDTKTGEWQQTATNKLAKKIDSEVDTAQSVLDIKSPYTDVAILKIEGTYPTVELGNGASVEESQEVTTMGYPVIADDGGYNKSKTVPTVTQGTITDVVTDAGNHRLFLMTAVIAGGNSGGPAFDKHGRQVGINTYGGTACPDGDGSCFGRGVARDIEDAKAMAAKHGIRPSSGKLTELWKSGLEDFSRGKYSAAKQKFAELNQQYPNNYAVTKLLAIANETKDDVVESEPSRPEGRLDTSRYSDFDAIDEDGLALYDIDAPLDGPGEAVVIVIVSVTSVVFLGLIGVLIAISVAASRTRPSYQQPSQAAAPPMPQQQIVPPTAPQQPPVNHQEQPPAGPIS